MCVKYLFVDEVLSFYSTCFIITINYSTIFVTIIKFQCCIPRKLQPAIFCVIYKDKVTAIINNIVRNKLLLSLYFHILHEFLYVISVQFDDLLKCTIC